MKGQAIDTLRGDARRVAKGLCEVECVDGPEVVEAQACRPPLGQSQRVADALKVLAHPGRLRVLMALEGRELCVCDLAHVLDTSLSSMSQQLKQLRTLGAIRFRAHGKLAYYRISDPYWLGLVQSISEKLHGANSN